MKKLYDASFGGVMWYNEPATDVWRRLWLGRGIQDPESAEHALVLDALMKTWSIMPDLQFAQLLHAVAAGRPLSTITNRQLVKLLRGFTRTPNKEEKCQALQLNTNSP